ncbi:MAG: hypothetical protein MUF01_12650 [Bryobacterales bacterium]|jgi:hypothetical protein|nr:hypothetical protein [Bryobacterales bacterium]
MSLAAQSRTSSPLAQFAWETQPEADAWLRRVIDDFLSRNPFAAALSIRMASETGTRFFDWVDHVRLPKSDAIATLLQRLGFQPDTRVFHSCYLHPGAIFPRVHFSDAAGIAVALKVDAVADFLQAHRLTANIEGALFNPLRRALVASQDDTELWVVERHGSVDLEVTEIDQQLRLAGQRHLEAFRTRPRAMDDPLLAFAAAEHRLRQAIDEIGRDVACAWFFQAEREYWQRRCKAGAIQKARQDRLGLGWANHDHHTYRSSRACFVPLIRVFEMLGFQLRERFTPGREAGWGAQVIEQPNAGITIFADVDMSPEELLGDFAHQSMPARQELGTVGLWCALHGEAFLEAGMHHLECQFDFTQLRHQLASDGVGMMKPFSEFPYLKQAFSQGDVWPVAEERVQRLLAMGQITPQQAQQFRREGALGAHLENLERNEGFKGFNQTGINEIIAGTDPRLAAANN